MKRFGATRWGADSRRSEHQALGIFLWGLSTDFGLD